MLVYLADLGHNILTLSSDVFPLGIANLATHARAHARGGDRLDIRLFREPQDLARALREAAPAVLGLSNYAWNQRLALEFARYSRELSPQTLVVMGGPNWPITAGEQEDFLRSMPLVDAYVDGPTYEGERAFTGLIERLLECGTTRESLTEAPVAGIDWIDPRDGAFVKGGAVERITDLDEIPSPYLAGLLDPYFATGYFPLLQIARGCPFSCAFCNSGVESNSRVYAHSVDAVKADLLYVAEHVAKETNLCLADDNFGMYRRDEEIADYVAWLQDHYDWPRYIRTTTGKNNTERIIRVLRKTRGALPMTSAVQSLNPDVLANIKRSNIKLETYAAIQRELEEQGLQSYGELILCLPGETRQSFLDAVEKLIDAGAKRISAHQLMLLHGAELSTLESRARFGFETRFRVVARNIGDYTGRKIAEIEEVVVTTPTFSWDDYLDCRVFHLLMTVFYYEGNYEEAFRVLAHHGVKPYSALVHIHARRLDAPPAFRALVSEFLRESEDELFADAESCLAWAEEHHDELASGARGGNLLSRFSLTGRFYLLEESLDFLAAALGDALTAAAAPPQAHDELAAAIDWLRRSLLSVPFDASLRDQRAFESRFDVGAWVQEHYARPLSAYRTSEPRRWAMVVAPETARLIRAKIATFGEHAQGLGKFTRTVYARDLRRQPRLVESETRS